MKYYNVTIQNKAKMNYTFIEINKKKLPIKFGFNALRKYSSKTKTSLQDLDKLGTDMTLDDALTLIYCGVEDGYRAAKQECELTIDDLADLIDGDFEAATLNINGTVTATSFIGDGGNLTGLPAGFNWGDGSLF